MAGLPGGVWWRFTRYEIRDGVIVPAPGARLVTYRPWDEYLKGRSRAEQEWEPPYSRLVRLVEDAPKGWDTALWREQPLPENFTRPLTEFCADHGLLGLLPHSLVAVTLHPTWEEYPKERAEDKVFWAPRQWAYHRVGGAAWGQRITFLPGRGTRRKQRAGQPVPRDLWPPDWRPSSVQFVELRTGRLVSESPGTALARFFPKVPDGQEETYQYPHPRTEEFCRAYGEPLVSFLRGAEWLGEILRALRGKHAPGGVRALNVLLSTVTPVVGEPDGSSSVLAWGAASLLGYFALMVAQDLLAGRRALVCDKCRHVFLASRYQTAYCSRTCRWAAQKRRQRAPK